MADEPLEYLAIVNLQQALQGIEVGKGYFYDVRGTAVKLDPDHAVGEFDVEGAPRPFVILEVKPERRDYEASSVVNITRPITVHWIGVADQRSDENVLQVFFRGISDVEKAVAAEPGRGGHASDTRIVSCAMNRDASGSEVWAMVDLEIWTRRTYGEPTQ